MSNIINIIRIMKELAVNVFSTLSIIVVLAVIGVAVYMLLESQFNSVEPPVPPEDPFANKFEFGGHGRNDETKPPAESFQNNPDDILLVAEIQKGQGTKEIKKVNINQLLKSERRVIAGREGHLRLPLSYTKNHREEFQIIAKDNKLYINTIHPNIHWNSLNHFLPVNQNVEVIPDHTTLLSAQVRYSFVTLDVYRRRGNKRPKLFRGQDTVI